MFSDERAASAVIVAASLPLLIGLVGLATDVAIWQMNKHRLQGAVDLAAYSTAVSSTHKATSLQAIAEGKSILASMGFVDGAGNVEVTITNPPSTGRHMGDTNAWEVRATKQPQLLFASLFLDTAPRIAARAVALNGTNPGSGCILALHPTASGAVTFTNNGDVPDDQCDVYTNSASASALKCDNNCDIYSNTYTVGGNYVTNHGTLHGLENKTGVSPAADPYAVLPRPTGSTLACDETATITAKASTPDLISPGVYCGGIDVASNKTLTMLPGVYYVESKFNLNGNSILEATGGVTIILLDGICIGDGSCQREKGIGNNVTIDLEAPTSGTFSGVALYAPGIAGSSKLQEFSNNAYLNI